MDRTGQDLCPLGLVEQSITGRRLVRRAEQFDDGYEASVAPIPDFYERDSLDINRRQAEYLRLNGRRRIRSGSATQSAARFFADEHVRPAEKPSLSLRQFVKVNVLVRLEI